MPSKFLLRGKDDVDNPTAPLVYWLGSTEGRMIAYKTNASGNRTALLVLLAAGARNYDDTGCNKALRVLYGGFDLPEFDSAGNRNWRFHQGVIPRFTGAYQSCTFQLAGNTVTANGHGFSNGSEIAFHARGGNHKLVNDLPRHQRYFVVNSTTNTFQIATISGGSAIDFVTAADATDTFVYETANKGFYDAEQGECEIFPNLKRTFAGLCYIEILLPAELSNAEDEPTKLKVIMDGKTVYDLQLDGGGVLEKIGQPISARNNALVAIDAVTASGEFPLDRFFGQSILDWRDRCDGLINWVGGNDVPAIPNYPTETNVTVSSDGDIQKTGGSGTAYDAIAATEQIAEGLDAENDCLYIGGDIRIGFSSIAAGTTIQNGVEALATGKLNLIQNGIATEIGQVFPSDRLRVEYKGSIFAIYRNSIPIEIPSGQILQPANDFYVVTQIKTSNQTVERVFITPSGTDATPRQVPRFTGGMILATQTPIPDIWNAQIQLTAGCSWQDIDGTIRVISDPDRNPVHTFIYDPASPSTPSNIKRVTVKRRKPDAVPNFWRFRIRNADDPIFTKAHTEVLRQDRIDSVGLKDSGIIDYGVMYLSHMERLGESRVRLAVDLDTNLIVEGFMDSAIKVSKGDFVDVIDPVGGFDGANPARCMVLRDLLSMGSGTQVEKGSFELVIVDPANPFYSDTAHGAIQPITREFFSLQFSPPPSLEVLTITESIRQLRGTSISVIDGFARFAPTPNQSGTVYIKTLLGDGFQIVPDNANDEFVGLDPEADAGLFSLKDTSVAVAETTGAGALPDGFDFEAEYILREKSAGVYELEDTSNNLITFTSDGTGTIKIFPYSGWKLTNLTIRPNPSTRETTFQIEPKESGFHYVRVVTESAAGVAQSFSLGKLANLVVQGDQAIPEPPENMRFAFDGLTLKTEFDESPSINVKGYQVTDDRGNIIIPFIDALHFAESVQTPNVKRRVYSISINGIRSTSFLSGTFSLPPAFAWQNIVGGNVNVEGNYIKTAANGFGNATAVANYCVLSGALTLKYIVDSITDRKVFGISDVSNITNQNQLTHAIHLDNGSADAYESGTDRNNNEAFAIDDVLELRVSAAGVVTYLKNNVVFYTSGINVTKHPVFVGIDVHTQNATLDANLEISGIFAPTNLVVPHFIAMLRVSYDSATNLLTGTGTSAWGSSGFTTTEQMAKGQDGAFYFKLSQTNKDIAVGMSTDDPDQDKASIEYGARFKTDGTFVATISNVESSSLGSYLTTDKFSLGREGANFVIRKNGVSVHSEAMSLDEMFLDGSFYSDGSIEVEGLRFSNNADDTGGSNATVQNFKTSAYVNDRPTTGITTPITPRDTSFPVIENLVAFEVFSEEFLLDYSERVKVQLKVEFPTDDYSNFHTPKRAEIRVLNKFGVEILNVPPFAIDRGGGLLPEITHSRRYADPDTEAIYCLRIENEIGWSGQIYLQNGSMSSVPIITSINILPQNLNLIPSPVNIGFGWTRSPQQNTTDQRLEYRQLNSKTWIQYGLVGDTTESLTIPLTDPDFNIQDGRWFEAQIVNTENDETSNTALAFFQSSPAALPTLSAPYEVTITPSTTQAVIDWEMDGTDHTHFDIYRDGTKINVSNVAQGTRTYTDSTVTEGTTYTYFVRAIFSGTEQLDSNPVEVTIPNSSSSDDPSDLVASAIGYTQIFAEWNLNGNTGAVELRYRERYTSTWTTVNLSSGTDSHTIYFLNDGTEYELQVKAGSSPFTDSKFATTFYDFRNDPELQN